MAYQAYVHCNYCNKVLGVEIPSGELRNPVPVQCQFCSNILFVQTGQSSSSTSSTSTQQLPPPTSSASTQQLPPPQEHFTVKPPEIKHRPATKYNEFVREEMKRIKDANPGISHVDAFSAASKNWARNGLGTVGNSNSPTRGSKSGCTATLNEET